MVTSCGYWQSVAELTFLHRASQLKKGWEAQGEADVACEKDRLLYASPVRWPQAPGWPRTCWRDYFSQLEKVAEEGGEAPLLRPCPHNQSPDKKQKWEDWMDFVLYFSSVVNQCSAILLCVYLYSWKIKSELVHDSETRRIFHIFTTALEKETGLTLHCVLSGQINRFWSQIN